ncbi:MAG TPA: FecR domain-containing protein [Sunxiuqinia sp.]|nr:FecR domain-containing protein [Sunxiuqinia sp.]
MSPDSKYKNYTIEEFVEDDDFRRWVEVPNEILTTFWTNFQQVFPEKVKLIEQARVIVETLSINEGTLHRDEYSDSLNQLKDHLRLKNERERKRVRRMRFIWQSAAAVLLIPLLTISVYWFANDYIPSRQSHMVSYIVPNGQKSNVILADGTTVWLNSGSKLSYAADPSGGFRRVKLEGEAYFEVTKDKHRPFIVETNDYSVKVYGTKFNVRAYDDLKESETILKEGAITIISNDHGEIKMNPGERFTLTNDDKYTISRVNPDLYLSWKDNILKINNERLSDLVIRMERWYGVKIKVRNFDAVKDLRYTLTIKTESLREMLELMRYVTPFNYTIDGENVVLNYQT